MAATPKSRTRAFRTWPDNEERLQFAEQIGMNISHLINEALQAKLPDMLKVKSDQLRKALAPAP